MAAPALQNFAGGQIYAASRVQTDFSFDAGGNRARQLKQRLNSDTSSLVEETTYLGSYEREVHSSKSAPAAQMVLTRTVHRHSIGGFAVYTRTDKPGLPSETKLTTILKDHLGSTDLLYTGTWTGSSFSIPTPASIERQSFDPWGERRAPDTLVSYRGTDADPFRSSAQDYDRGYIGHEQLDDSGLIHMNGRIYDPELGRMLSPDPFVQVPEYSQNFNRYSYVMNNPLNLTDPSGFSWLSKAFKKIGNWFKENWRTVVVIVVAAFLVLSGIGATLFAGLWGALGGGIVVAGSYLSIIGTGALVGAITGGLGAALAGGSLGDVLRGALIGGISGALTGALHPVGGTSLLDAANVVGHGVVGGASNVAMGGKFQDGFLSAAASAATAMTGLTSTNKGTFGGDNLNLASRTMIASIAGGTASALGGGKFANGALTGAMTHLLNAEAGSWLEGEMSPKEILEENQTVARRVAELKNKILADGKLSRSEAESWYIKGNGEPLQIQASSAGLSYKDVDHIKWNWSQKLSAYIQTTRPSKFADWSVHGTMILKSINPFCEFKIYDAKYDFEMHRGFRPATIMRNVLTIAGNISAGPGNPYEIQYRGIIAK